MGANPGPGPACAPDRPTTRPADFRRQIPCDPVSSEDGETLYLVLATVNEVEPASKSERAFQSVHTGGFQVLRSNVRGLWLCGCSPAGEGPLTTAPLATKPPTGQRERDAVLTDVRPNGTGRADGLFQLSGDMLQLVVWGSNGHTRIISEL